MSFSNAVRTSASAALRKPINPSRPVQQCLSQCHARVALTRLTPAAMSVRWQTTVQSEQPAEKKRYSDVTKKVVYGMARLLGYYSTGSTAIRASHDLYRTCAEHAEKNKDFFIEACNLPDNFQSWFSVTQLHVWMLMVRLREEKNGKLYIQELVNRLFDDAEHKMRSHGITQQRMINSYIKDLLAQFHGGVVAYDEGMCKDDPVLAAALWR
ncbi:ubiquinol-cytochrome C chaperone-domain-containing protein [Zychaea mexicana]|uniref:ubiquinol-cytochrome C chaperone-domain-containing protein n=1 Tax=Zychaea mexicana TaxID=64656 RepID=UPI0022FE1085|nr:ubiquinol-cytochrome C chaperone-domain-containing protein [Zychaea mexicana]KAI9479520.1 ubiquinol-cytochrome C chaperone-domain-containing protein [Zychaea mexicana]